MKAIILDDPAIEPFPFLQELVDGQFENDCVVKLVMFLNGASNIP